MTAPLCRADQRIKFWRNEVRAACHAIRIYRLAVGRGLRNPSHQEYSDLCRDVHKARRRYKVELINAMHERRAA